MVIRVEKWPLDSISVGYIQLVDIKDFHIHDQILICVIRLHADRGNHGSHGSHSQNA